MPRLAIVVALREELAAVQAAIPDAERQDVLLLRGGVGWTSATKAAWTLQKSLIGPPKWICSSGFCGGLAENLGVGDIVLADSIQGPDGETMALPPPGMPEMLAALNHAGVKSFAGSLVTVRSAVFSCAEKRALGQARHALAVDMESFAIASVASVTGAKIFAMRAVSDGVGDALPPEVGTFLTDDGRVRGTAVLKFVSGGPRNMKALWGLKTRSDKASAGLTAAWKAVWPELSKLI